MSEHTLEYGLKAREYDTADFQDESVKRIMKKLSDIDRAALDKTELEEVCWRGDRRTKTQTLSLQNNLPTSFDFTGSGRFCC